MYGYRAREELFLKIHLYNPSMVKRYSRVFPSLCVVLRGLNLLQALRVVSGGGRHGNGSAATRGAHSVCLAGVWV